MEVTDPTCLGTTTFGEPEPISECFPGDPTRKLTGTCAHGEWRPLERIAKFLPKDFKVPLDCYTAADGLRRIVPRCNFEELIDLGAVGGRAICRSEQGFDQYWDDYCTRDALDPSVRLRATVSWHARDAGTSHAKVRILA